MLTPIIITDDSGYHSELPSPALSSPSNYSDSDLERTPRVQRSRASSPLTPLTPDFAFPSYPPAHVPHTSTAEHAPFSTATHDYFSPMPYSGSGFDDSSCPSATSCNLISLVSHPASRFEENPLLSAADQSFVDALAHTPTTKPKFQPIKNMLLGRKRPAALNFTNTRALDFADGTYLDNPRSASAASTPGSFFHFSKEPRRPLLRRNSEDLLSRRKHARVDALELESFLMF
jgi:hypothetical protein